MIKTILVLSDGSEIMAGMNQVNAIQSTSVVESCNDGDDLSFGSVCSKKIIVNIITPKNTLPINAGEKITLYQEENGNRIKKGVFLAEKPQKKNANTTRIEAYDNISLLDKEVSDWFNSLDGFPYTAYDMAKMAFDECGIGFKNETIPNGDYEIFKTELESVTARQIIRWVGEICGCFCVVDEDGNAVYRWYEKKDTPIVATRRENSITFFQGSLSYEDYETKKVDRVQIRQNKNEVGIVYPNGALGENPYIIESNPFLIDSSKTASVAESLYKKIKDMSYTPCKVSLPASLYFDVGDIVEIEDANGVKIVSCVMNKTRSGQKETIECTGNYKRNGATELYSTSFTANYKNSWKTQRDVARIEIKSDENRTAIDSIVSWIGDEESGATKYFAQLTISAEQNAADIELLAQSTVDGFQDVSAQLAVKVGKDENDQIVSMLNASAQVIRLKSNRLTIESDNFNLSEDGIVVANGAILDGTFKNVGTFGEVSIYSGAIVMETFATKLTIFAGGFDMVDDGNNKFSMVMSDGVAAIYGGSGRNSIFLQEDNITMMGTILATPATGGTYSQVMTRQDLVNLGLISQ